MMRATFCWKRTGKMNFERLGNVEIRQAEYLAGVSARDALF